MFVRPDFRARRSLARNTCDRKTPANALASHSAPTPKRAVMFQGGNLLLHGPQRHPTLSAIHPECEPNSGVALEPAAESNLQDAVAPLQATVTLHPISLVPNRGRGCVTPFVKCLNRGGHLVISQV